MEFLLNKFSRFIIILMFSGITLYAQNEVCFNIQNNPNPFNPALNAFTKYINVLDCFHIYAESSISDGKILHAASVAAELLDNNEDGIVDVLDIVLLVNIVLDNKDCL